MDPFVRRLIERLHDPARPLSRNRHFHTFDTPEGKKALAASRRLLGLQKDILNTTPEVRHRVTEEGEHRIELRFRHIAGRRTSVLTAAEFDLLQSLPGVREALTGATPPETRSQG